MGARFVLVIAFDFATDTEAIQDVEDHELSAEPTTSMAKPPIRLLCVSATSRITAADNNAAGNP
jgi:hypothetical protein